MRWRCAQCGNLTRFDVVRTASVREYVHLTMAGEPSVEHADVMEEALLSVTCRWCGSQDVEEVPRPGGASSGA
jgi:hypothetical protein